MFAATRISPHARKIKHFVLPLSYLHAKPFSFVSSSPPPFETQLKDKQSPFELFSNAEINTQQSQIQLQTLVTNNNAEIKNFSREGNFNEIACQSKEICIGCGVHMQNIEYNQPGYYKIPKVKHPYSGLKVNREFPIEEFNASNLFKKGFLYQLMLPEPPPKPHNRPVVCTRCHWLRYYDNLNNPTLETRLPEFDFYNAVGRKIATASGVSSVVMMVVDAVDFDGSFPKMVAELVSETIEKCSVDWKEGKSGNVPRLVLVLSKVDLLPTNVSPTRLEHWVRQRAKECGAIQLAGLHMVSAVRGWGVGHLIEDVTRLVGPKGNVWAVGAQNAGKSTLINAMQRCVREKEEETETGMPKRTKEEKKIRKKMGGAGLLEKGLPCLTESGWPGTTLGIVRVEGILPGKAKLFDTPGLHNPHHMMNRLTIAEQRLVHITKELRPRTYRVNAGRSIHIAGLLRLDIEELSVDTVYITVWASALLPLHMSRTENVDKMKNEFFGRQLQPPIGEDRIKELGNWVRREFHVGGTSWQENAVDVAAAGVGWFSIGLNGEAIIGVWTYDGIEVTVRKALLPQRAPGLEIAGFSASRIVREADRNKDFFRSKKKSSRGKSNAETSFGARKKRVLMELGL